MGTSPQHLRILYSYAYIYKGTKMLGKLPLHLRHMYQPQRYGIVAQHQIECRKEYDFPRLILYVVRAEMIIRIVNLDLKCQNSSFYFVFIKIFEAFPLK